MEEDEVDYIVVRLVRWVVFISSFSHLWLMNISLVGVSSIGKNMTRHFV
jgi:hypothetical protein